jgi:formylglycine-generating enzyme
LSYYVINQKQTYLDYLKARLFIQTGPDGHPQIIMETSGHTLGLLADDNSLALYNIVVLQHAADSETGQVRLAYTPEESDETYPELLSTFHWGLADRLARIGHMNERLVTLTQKTDSPEQSLSFNHFEKAREAFSKRDYPLALLEIDRAVYGDSTSAGFRSEWRFYFLQGIIHLGFYGCDPELVDLAKAEEALVNAAMFSRADFTANTAIAYLAASWAAYCRGSLTEATGHAGKAVEINPKLAEGYFLLAKYNLAAGKIIEGLDYCKSAVESDTFYALKAAADGDFQAHESELHDCLTKLKHARFETFKNKIFSDMDILKSQTAPPDLQEVVNRFSEEKSLLEISRAEHDWNEFKVRPVFLSKKLDSLSLEHESLVKVIEPYREKVVVKASTWYRKEEAKLITKNRVVERKKKSSYEISLFRDAFMFFTGKVLVEFNMVVVEGGKFKMGDTNAIGRIDERPLQEVTLSPFLMSSSIVTQKLWNLVMDDNPSNFHGYELPVEHVSWYDCIEFCNKLSEMAGFQPCYTIQREVPDPNNFNKTDSVKWTVSCDWEATGYRLPTEAEWEFAAKGGNNGNYYRFSGGDSENIVCWYKDNSHYKTQEVCQKQSNELGLYDMSGNVWEWCWDWYDNYKEAAFQDPRGPESGSYRVLRGGSWADSLNYQRTASRGKENPLGRYTSIGVRIVRSYLPA